MNSRNLTTQEFIARARKVHKDKYDYSQTSYINLRLKVNIGCPVHGVFSQLASGHLRGRGCFVCANQDTAKCTREIAKINRLNVSDIIVPNRSKAVPLSGGGYALVDEEDYERVMDYNWCKANGYAISKIDSKNVRMHRFIMNVTDPKIQVDHKFHNTLDNRKSKLRICKTGQNAMNQKPQKGRSSQYKGVSWHKINRKWVANIKYKQNTCHLGSFSKEEDAAKAYDNKAKELFGEFAFLNFK